MLGKAEVTDSMETGLGGFLEHAPFAYLGLFMVVSGSGPRPRRSGSWTLLVCTEFMRLLQSSSINSPETKIYDRQKTFFPNHIVTSHRNENIRRVRVKHHLKGRWICRAMFPTTKVMLQLHSLVQPRTSLHSKQAHASLLKFTFLAGAMDTYPSDGLFRTFLHVEISLIKLDLHPLLDIVF